MLKKVVLLVFSLLCYSSLNTFAQESIYIDGYLEGYEAAHEDYIYDDYMIGLNEEELRFYKKGYYAGFIEGGGGALLETFTYYLFIKSPLNSLTIMLVFILIILLILNLRNKKTGNSTMKESIADPVPDPKEGEPSESYIENHDKNHIKEISHESIEWLNKNADDTYNTFNYTEHPSLEDGTFYYKDTRSKSAINKGDAGELLVHNELLKLEQYEEYNVLLNLNLLTSIYENKPVQIDHLVISKYGVFVIETKNYSGNIYGHVLDEYWKASYGSTRYNLLNPIIQNSTHLYAIKAKASEVIDELNFIKKLPDGNSDFYSGIYSIIVFTGNAKLNIEGQSFKEKVLYLPELLDYILRYRQVHFTEEQTSILVNKIIDDDIEVINIPS